MRIATYNVEWFNALFDDDGALFDDMGWSARHDVTRADQTAALGVVFQSLDADAVMVVEAPDQSRSRSSIAALTAFVDRFSLRTSEIVLGFANDTQQEIALLYDPDKMTARHAPQGAPSGPDGATGAPRFDGALRIDLDIDATEDLVVFSKPPLEIEVKTRGGLAFHMMGVHLKSKAPHGARNADEAMRISIANRRKQLAQAIWLRARIDQHLDAATPIMVMGDLNDGPGLDEFEHLFGRSSVEIVLGHGGSRPLNEPHARRALGRSPFAIPTSARFWIRQENRYLQALLDYIMLSDDLCARNPRWRIWHPMDDPACWQNTALRDALVMASDHFPVTVDFDDFSQSG